MWRRHDDATNEAILEENMNASPNDSSRTLNTAAIRTLQTLQRTLRRQIDALMEIGCEDPEAAETIVFAIENAERSLERARDMRRKLLRSE